MVQSVERAFAILDAVAKRPAGVTALADRLDLPKSTVARLLGSLEELGAVERLDGKRWQVGPSVEAFARTVPPERRLAPLARPALVRARPLARRGRRPRAAGRLRRPLRRPGRVRPPGAGARLDGNARADARRSLGARPDGGLAGGRGRRLRRARPSRVDTENRRGSRRAAGAAGAKCARRAMRGASRSSRKASTRSRLRSVMRKEMPSQRSTSTARRTASRPVGQRSELHGR